MYALNIQSLFPEQTGFDVASDYGEDIFHSSQHHRKKTGLAVRPGLHFKFTVGS